MTISTSIPRGALIVIEGCDRAGKSSLCKSLTTYLNQNGKAATLKCFPGASSFYSSNVEPPYLFFLIDRTTNIGRNIDAYLKGGIKFNDKDVHLLFSENRHEAMYVQLLLALCDESSLKLFF